MFSVIYIVLLVLSATLVFVECDKIEHDEIGHNYI